MPAYGETMYSALTCPEPPHATVLLSPSTMMLRSRDALRGNVPRAF